MPTQYIQDLCHKPITEMGLDELGYILLEIFSEDKPPINVYSIIMGLRDRNDYEGSFNIMSEAVQWLCNQGLIMNSLGNRDNYHITRKGDKHLKSRDPDST